MFHRRSYHGRSSDEGKHGMGHMGKISPYLGKKRGLGKQGQGNPTYEKGKKPIFKKRTGNWLLKRVPKPNVGRGGGAAEFEMAYRPH